MTGAAREGTGRNSRTGSLSRPHTIVSLLFALSRPVRRRASPALDRHELDRARWRRQKIFRYPHLDGLFKFWCTSAGYIMYVSIAFLPVVSLSVLSCTAEPKTNPCPTNRGYGDAQSRPSFSSATAPALQHNPSCLMQLMSIISTAYSLVPLLLLVWTAPGQRRGSLILPRRKLLLMVPSVAPVYGAYPPLRVWATGSGASSLRQACFCNF